MIPFGNFLLHILINITVMVMMVKTAMTELISEMIVTEQRKAVFLYTNSGEPLCKCNHLKMMISPQKKEGDDELMKRLCGDDMTMMIRMNQKR